MVNKKKSDTTIWRVQNKAGQGPYNPKHKGNIFSVLCEILDYDDNQRPAPWDDKKLSKVFTSSSAVFSNPQYLCGFQSLEQFYLWFNTKHVRSVLDITGFFLTEYRIAQKNIIEGKTHIMFLPENATVSAFRRCNKPETITDFLAIHHRPINEFLKNFNISQKPEQSATNPPAPN